MKKVLLYLSLLLSSYSYAFIAGDIEVSGKVINFDKNFVTLQKGKAKIEVPKRTVKTKNKLTTGIEVKAFLTVKQFNDTILRAKKNNRRLASQRAKRKHIKSARIPASSEYFLNEAKESLSD